MSSKQKKSTYNNQVIYDNNSQISNSDKNIKKKINFSKNNKIMSIPKYSPANLFCQKIQEINKPNENGYTPLYCAILSENIDAVNDLLILGSDPNIQNNLGETSLHLSVNKNNLDSLFLLLKYNCDCNKQNKKGNTALHIAIEKNMGNIVQILLRNKANPNIKNKIYGQTATHLAVINRLDENILKLFKENNADMFLIKDKYNKTPFEYAKDSNDEYYIHLLIKIFRSNKSFNNNKYIDKQMHTWNEKKVSKNLKKLNLSNKSMDKNLNILNYSDRYKYNYNLDKISNKKALVNSEKNKNEIKLEENSYSSSNKNKIKISDKNIYTHGRAIVSSDLCSNNIQIKELNNSYENENSIKSKKSISGFFEDEMNNINIITYKQNNDDINNKENTNVSNCKNSISQVYSMKSENSNNSELSKNKNFRNSENTNNNSIINNSKYLNNNINFSHSSSINNSNKSNKTNNSQNIYQTNSLCANRKLIKSIINDTVKKIVVKTISSSDGGDNDGNVNLLSKDSLHNIEDNKEDKIENIIIKDEININPNSNTKTNKENFNSEINNCIDNSVNLYENGTTSFVLYKNKNSSDISNNIIINNLGNNNENKSINISNIYDEINNTNTNKSNNNKNNVNINSNEYITDNNINRNKTINLNKINYKEKEDKENYSNYKKKINNNMNLNSLNSLNNNDIKDNIFLSSTNSHIFSELNMNSNINNCNLTNNNISLSYSKNLQSEEDYNYNSTTNENYKSKKNSDEKRVNEYSSSNNKKKIYSNLNLDFNMIDENEEKNELNKNKNSISSNILHGSNCTIKKVSDNNNKNNNHKKKISNGKVNQSREINNSILLKKSKSFMESISQKKNNFNKSIYTPSELERINENIKDKNKTNIYQKHHRQLSYHLNYKSYLNNNKDKEFQKNNINIINNNTNINNTSLSASTNDLIYRNKNNIMNSLINNSLTKSKSKPNINNISIQNDNNNKVSLINKSLKSINNTVTHNINSNTNNINESNINFNINNLNNINNSNNINNQNKKNRISSVANTTNNTAFSTINKPKYSPSRQSKNTNKINIPFNNKYNINNYNDDMEYLDEEFIDNNKLNSIPTNILIRLRDWLISCDLLCYYNLFIIKNMYNIDSYIHDIREGNFNLTYKHIEKMGIRKPGHIFRILIKLEIDSGIINNNLFDYIVERISYYSNNTTLALTSSINDINCCGINFCSKQNNNKIPTGNNKKINRNNELFFNDLSSFLRNYNIYKFKGNFLYNGFDKIEFIIIQLFSKYAFNKEILNDCLHVYLDKDKIKLLNKLYQVKYKIAKEYGIEIDEDEINKMISISNKGNKFERNKNKIYNYDFNGCSDNSIKKSLSNFYFNNNSSSIQKSSSFYNNNISNNNSNIQENNKENESNNLCYIF